MAVSLPEHARRALQVGLADKTAGDEIADVIEAQSGTLTARTKDYLAQALVNEADATAMAVVIDAGTALTGDMQAKLGIAIADRTAAQQIATALAAA